MTKPICEICENDKSTNILLETVNTEMVVNNICPICVRDIQILFTNHNVDNKKYLIL